VLPSEEKLGVGELPKNPVEKFIAL